jgi:hypothetical protein
MNKGKSFLAATAMLLTMLPENIELVPELVPQISVKNPWYNFHVSKAMRAGKTPKEIDALRKELWEQGGEDHGDYEQHEFDYS